MPLIKPPNACLNEHFFQLDQVRRRERLVAAQALKRKVRFVSMLAFLTIVLAHPFVHGSDGLWGMLFPAYCRLDRYAREVEIAAMNPPYLRIRV